MDDSNEENIFEDSKKYDLLTPLDLNDKLDFQIGFEGGKIYSWYLE